jgi:TonB family protein
MRVMPEPLSCGHFEDLAVLYALGELDGSARAGIEEHVRVCRECAAMLQREMALAAILAPASRPAGEREPSDLLLTRCRNKLAGTLDDTAVPSRPGAWTAEFSLREWIATFRLSPRFHPAWSVAALLVVGAVSGLAGWEGIGRAPLQLLGPAMITVSAAPPPVPAAAPQAPAPRQPAAGRVAEDTHVYAATDAGMNDAFHRDMFDSNAAQDQLQRQAASVLPRSEAEATPRAWRHEPPLRMPAGLRSAATLDVPASGSLSELSRTMEKLWWGGIRVDPDQQQRRLLLAPLPEYPEVARRAGIEGQVTLLLRIGKNGSVEDVQLLSGEPVLGRAAAEAIEQWRYSPLRIGGQPVNILTSVTLAFQLR